MEFNELNEARRSQRSYVPGYEVSHETIERLLEEAALAPSSMNQQGWHVIALTSQEEKQKLYREACNQQQVLDSSAMIIVCGNLEQHKNLPEILEKTPSVDEKTRARMIQMATNSYANNVELARDEALRSASYFSMAFMYAATNAGFGTCPMIGFDSDKMCAAFGIKHPLFPALLISFGKVKTAPYPRGYRRPASVFARFL